MKWVGFRIDSILTIEGIHKRKSGVEKRKSLLLALLSTSHGINHIYQLLIPIVIPRIIDEFLLSTTSAAILISVFVLSYSIFQAPSGFLSRVLGRKNIIVVGFGITSFSFLAVGFVNDLMLLAILFFLAGVGGSTYHPNGMPLLSEFYEDNRGQAAGFHQTGGSLGAIAAPLIIGPLVVSFSWRFAIIILSILGIVFALGLLLLLTAPRQVFEKNPRPEINESKESGFKTYLPSLVLIAAAMTQSLGIRGVDSFAVLYFQMGRGITSYIEATLLFATLKVAGLFSGPLCGRLSDVFERKRTIAVLVILEACSLYLLTIVPTDILAIPCLIFGFSTYGLLGTTDAFLADITPRDYMTAIFGVHFTLSFFNQFIISPIFGLIVDYSKSFDLGFVMLSVIALTGLPILHKVKTKSEVIN